MIATRKQLARWADLRNRKDREESGLFLAEGRKLVDEVLAAGWSIEALLTSQEESETGPENSYFVTREQMERVSSLRTAADVMAVVRRPLSLERPHWSPGTLALVLDGLQDPGNVGTLLRTAAWFGFSVFYTPDTADPFGPKAVQASMGAIFQVKVGIADEMWWEELPAEVPVFGTFLSGESVFGAPLSREGLLVLGNEGHGIRSPLEQRVTRRLTVPRFSDYGDSLNVGAAAAVLMAEFRRGEQG